MMNTYTYSGVLMVCKWCIGMHACTSLVASFKNKQTVERVDLHRTMPSLQNEKRQLKKFERRHSLCGRILHELSIYVELLFLPHRLDTNVVVEFVVA